MSLWGRRGGGGARRVGCVGEGGGGGVAIGVLWGVGEGGGHVETWV